MTIRWVLVVVAMIGALLVAHHARSQREDVARLEAKSARVSKLLPGWLAAGGRPDEIAPLGQRVDAGMKAGNLRDAENTLDAILAIVTEPPSPAAKTGSVDMATIQAKSARVQALLPKWVAAGGRQEEIVPLGQQIDAQMKGGRLEDANTTLDRLLAILSATPRTVAPTTPATALICPGTALTLSTGGHVLREDCTIKGDVTLGGTASISVERAHLVIDGNVVLSEDAALKVVGGTLTIANHTVMQHSISARDHARLEMIDATLETNAGEMHTTLTSSYHGFGDTLLRFVNTRFSTNESWLLADFSDRSRLESIDSDAVPSEVYPHDAATITIRGPRNTSRVWLEFRPGMRGRLDHLPSDATPYTFSFGRNTPALTNVDYQVDLSESRAGFGVNSHPRSELTVKDNAAPLTIGFWIDGSSPPEPISGLEAGTGTPITRTFTHQGRTLRLEKVVLNPYAWQMYAAPPRPASTDPIRIEQSTINELGIFCDTPVVVRDVHVQWAIIGATSAHADVTIRNSEIDAQAVIAENASTVRIEDSSVYGSILQAGGRSSIAVINSNLEGNRSNPAIARGAPPTLKPADEGRIVVLGLRPLPHPHRPGAATPLEGEAYVRTADGLSTPDYALSYRRVGDDAATTIQPSRAGGTGRLGTLPATLRDPGNYEVTVELTVGGTTYRASRTFTVTANSVQP